VLFEEIGEKVESFFGEATPNFKGMIPGRARVDIPIVRQPVNMPQRRFHVGVNNIGVEYANVVVLFSVQQIEYAQGNFVIGSHEKLSSREWGKGKSVREKPFYPSLMKVQPLCQE